MAEPNYLLCDICGKQVDRRSRIFVAVGFSRDAAGGPSPDHGEYLDLCSLHLASAVMVLLQEKNNPTVHNHEAGKRLMEWVKKLQSARKEK